MAAEGIQRARILIADDSDVCRTVLAILLKNAGFEVTSVVNGREAVGKLRAQSFDLAILDHEMPELDGLGTATELRSFAPDLPVVICSATLSDKLRSSYAAQRIAAVYDKPVDPRKLREEIPALLERSRSTPSNASATRRGRPLADTFQAVDEADIALEKPVFAGGSSHVRKLVADFGRIRDFRSAAMVIGPPGSAFLDVAVALAETRDAHILACDAQDVSDRRLSELLEPSRADARETVLIILGSERLDLVQQDLLDSVLATRSDTPASTQAARVRLVLCAERDLTALADSDGFNEVLLMRAGAMKLGLPSMAQRRADIPHIAQAVLRRIGVRAVQLAPESLAWLEQADWPGDYHQLHRTIDIAHQQAPHASVLDASELKVAFATEPEWRAPLYHDVLRSTLVHLLH